MRGLPSAAAAGRAAMPSRSLMGRRLYIKPSVVQFSCSSGAASRWNTPLGRRVTPIRISPASILQPLPHDFLRRSFALSASPTPASSSSSSESSSSNSSSSSQSDSRRRRQHVIGPLLARLPLPLLVLVLVLPPSLFLYHFSPTFRHAALAIQRCLGCAKAFLANVIDYKLVLRGTYDSNEAYYDALSQCHRRCAERVLRILQKNGGVFIKLGQHLASVQVLPLEWTSTMRPLQDQCDPSPLSAVQRLLVESTEHTIDELFSSFDPRPIGVASLAQVHIAVDRKTGKKVAVKVQHPGLDEYAEVDIKTVQIVSKGLKWIFPEFEFGWLADEMAENLPLELDFRHEAGNAARCRADFAKHRRTTLYIPEVLWTEKRAMCMEFIEGARPDDLVYLKENHIDRNQVSKSLARIFSEMVYMNGFFHADPHPGNLLIRPAQPNSRSPYNFEICLLDHGLYFDLSDELRVNYARLWLALLQPATPAVAAERRKYAELVGNISPDMYPIFESAITGRAGLEGSFESENQGGPRRHKRASGLLEPSPVGNVSDVERIREALVTKEGLVASIFDMLRRVPRRLLMVLKLNDLTRHLDAQLHTTHDPARPFLIIARYCSLSVYNANITGLRTRYATQGPSLSLLHDYVWMWWSFVRMDGALRVVEGVQDLRAKLVLLKDYAHGWWVKGMRGAEEAAAGLVVDEPAGGKDAGGAEKAGLAVA